LQRWRTTGRPHDPLDFDCECPPGCEHSGGTLICRVAALDRRRRGCPRQNRSPRDPGGAQGRRRRGASRRSETGGRPNIFASLSQEFEVGGQRGLRIEAAQYGLDRETSNAKQAQVTLAANVKSAFFRAMLNQERVRLAEQNLNLNTDLVRRTQTEQPSAPGEKLELNNVRIQESRVRRELAAAQQAHDDTTDALRRFLDLSPEADLTLVGSSEITLNPPLPVQELIDRARQQRADVQAFEQALKAADAQLRLQHRERIPNVTLSGSYSRFDSNNYAGGDVGFSLPVFQTKGPEITEAAAERQRAEFELQNIRREVEREVRETLRNYTTAYNDVQEYRNTILPLSEDNVQLQKRLLDRDEISPADLINQQIELIGARREYLDAVERYDIAAIELERVTGGAPILDKPAP
jgi:cobalt-zinc-cadmium efflux system outer membrane protein